MLSIPESYQTVTTAIDIMFSQNQNAIDMDFVKNKLLLEEARQPTFNQEMGRNVAFMGSQMQRGFCRSTSGNLEEIITQMHNFRFNCHLCNKAGKINILEEIYIKVEAEASGAVMTGHNSLKRVLIQCNKAMLKKISPRIHHL